MATFLYDFKFLVILIIGSILIFGSLIFSTFIEKSKIQSNNSIFDNFLLNIMGLVVNICILKNLFESNTNIINLLIPVFISMIIYLILLIRLVKNYKLLFTRNIYLNNFYLSFLLIINIISTKIYIAEFNCLFALISLISCYINIKLLNDIKNNLKKKELYLNLLFNYISIFVLSMSLFYNLSKII